MLTPTIDEVTGLPVRLVNTADWTGPDVPDGWLIANAPRPLAGPQTWTGDFRCGIFYAAAPELVPSWRADDARLIRFITNADIEARIDAYLVEREYGTLDELGLTYADIAPGMELPYVESGR